MIPSRLKSLPALTLVSTLGAALFLQILAFVTRGRTIPIYWHLARRHDVCFAWVELGLCGIAGFLVWRARHSIASKTDSDPVAAFMLWIHRSIWGIALGAWALYSALGAWCFQRSPLVMDEYCVLFQARIFAAGKLTTQVAPELVDFLVSQGFQGIFLGVSHAQGTIASMYWPGAALLATPFVFLGVPWLFNPTLTMLSLVAIHKVAYRLTHSAPAAGWAAFLTLCSPLIAMNAGTYYAMPANLLFNTLFCALLLQESRRHALLAGVVGGFALVLSNPLPHTLFALPWLVFLLRRQRHLLWPCLLGYLVFAIPLGLGWRLLLRQFDPAIPVLTLGQIFNVPTLLLLMARLLGIVKTMVWAVPGLLVLALWGWRAAPTPQLRLLGASLLTTFVGYFVVVFDQGHGWGFRYIHGAWLALPILAATVLAPPREPIAGATKVGGPEVVSRGAKRFVVLLGLLSLLVTLPFQTLLVQGFVSSHNAQVPAPNARAALVFIRAGGNFRQDLVQNDPFLREPAWHVCFLSEAKNARLARRWLAHPRRVQSGEWGETWVGDAFMGSP